MESKGKWFSSSTFLFKKYIYFLLCKYVCVCYMWMGKKCAWFMIETSWRFLSISYFIVRIRFIEFVMLHKRIFWVHKENKLCHNLPWYSFFCCLYQNRRGKNIAFVFGKIYWHTFCWFFVPKVLVLECNKSRKFILGNVQFHVLFRFCK